MGHDGDWEILFYNGATVQPLTNNTVIDSDPQVYGSTVAWCQNYNSLWFYDGTTVRLVSDNINTTSINYYLYSGGLLWWRSDQSLMLYEPGRNSSRGLQDYAEGYTFEKIVGFDDKGVLWCIGQAPNYTLKLYDGSLSVYYHGHRLNTRPAPPEAAKMREQTSSRIQKQSRGTTSDQLLTTPGVASTDNSSTGEKWGDKIAEQLG